MPNENVKITMPNGMTMEVNQYCLYRLFRAAAENKGDRRLGDMDYSWATGMENFVLREANLRR